MFYRYLKVVDDCPHCGEALHHQRADDAPTYFTIVIVGHVVVSLVLAVEMAYRPRSFGRGVALSLLGLVLVSTALAFSRDRELERRPRVP